MAQSILWMPCFDYINGKVAPDRDMIKKDIISIYDAFYSNMNWKLIYDVNDFIKNGYNELKCDKESYGDQIKEYIQHIIELNIVDCVGCKHCIEGYVVDPLDSEKTDYCYTCSGDFRPCDHADKIREFSEKYGQDTFLKYYKKDEKEIQDDIGYLVEFIDSLLKLEDLDSKKIDELVDYILSLNH